MEEDNCYRRTVRAVIATLEEIKHAFQDGALMLPNREARWLGKLEEQVASLPDNEGQAMEEAMKGPKADKFLPEEYGL
jgi:hypothetical protein